MNPEPEGHVMGGSAMEARPDVTGTVAAPLRNARGVVPPMIVFIVVIILILTLAIFQFG